MCSSGIETQPASLAVDVEPKSPPAQIQLIPLSSIAGIVVDENREPLQGVVVQGIAVKASLDGPDYVPARTARTDDRGGYAFLDLPPGDYVVRLAGEASSTRYFLGSRLNPNNDHRGLQPVYYPSGDSPASATVLHLGPGERAGADFRQATEPAFDIDGRLASISPGAWTQVQLYRDGDILPLGAAFVNLSSGQFRIVDVPRGRYTLPAVQYRADPPKWLAAETQVMVSSEPIRNLMVELSGGADIPVSVSYEAGAQSKGQFQLMLRPQHTRSNSRHLTIGRMPKRPKRPGLPGQEQCALMVMEVVWVFNCALAAGTAQTARPLSRTRREGIPSRLEGMPSRSCRFVPVVRTEPAPTRVTGCATTPDAASREEPRQGPPELNSRCVPWPISSIRSCSN